MQQGTRSRKERSWKDKEYTNRKQRQCKANKKASLQKKIKIKKRQNKTRNENEAKPSEDEKYKRKANEFNTLAWQSKES